MFFFIVFCTNFNPRTWRVMHFQIKVNTITVFPSKLLTNRSRTDGNLFGLLFRECRLQQPLALCEAAPMLTIEPLLSPTRLNRPTGLSSWVWPSTSALMSSIEFTDNGLFFETVFPRKTKKQHTVTFEWQMSSRDCSSYDWEQFRCFIYIYILYIWWTCCLFPVSN